MRKLSCWLIVAIMVLHMSAYSMDHNTTEMDFDVDEGVDPTHANGRHSHQLSGNQTASGSDCNFTNMADGMGGPEWASTATYSVHDIVEWPSESGQFWQTITAGPTSEPGTTTKWIGPCSCEAIAEDSGITWNSTVAYNAWQILEHNGSVWFVLDAGTTAGDLPGVAPDLWRLCEGSCGSLVNMSTPVWANSTLVSEGEVYEYPANSDHFYTVVGVGMSNQTVGAPGVDLDAWGEPLHCDCKEIWEDSGMPLWDATVEYFQNAVVEWPAGSNALYYSFDHGTGIEPGTSQSPQIWRLCSGEAPSGFLCDDFNGTGGKVWTNTTNVTAGDIFQYPAGSGNFYIVSAGISAQLVGAPGVDLDAWSEKYCTCEEIWEAGSQTVWDANSTYSSGTIVLHPANSTSFWIAVMPSTTAGVEPGQPWADGNEWELCGQQDNASSGPCGGSDYVGAWYDMARVSTGEIYEHPAGSENYYQVVIQGYVDQEVLSPTVDLDVWAPVVCPCEEVWMNSGQPVWDATTTYYEDDVVEWPSGSNQLWIALDNQFSTVEPSMADISWEKCLDTNTPSTTPCAGLDIVGVWNSSMNVTSGEIYEYPAGSENFYQVNAGSPFWSVNAPDVDMDVWSPIDCPCKETWVANGQPVWDTSTIYSVNDVVEWPATSGTLWIALNNSFNGAEPTLSALDWDHCDGSAMPYSNPCAGLDVLGVWDASMNVTSGEIYEYPSGSQDYYQVNPGSPFWNVNAPDVDMDVWSPIDCPCKETWVANGQPVWVAGTAYPGGYVVEHPATSGNLYTPLESGGVTSGAGEPGVDTHWVLCNGNGPSPGPCDGLSVAVWDNTTAPAIGDVYQFPANSGTYFQIVFTHDDASGGPDWVADPVMDGGLDEFWTPYTCPCEETWTANGEPVWDNTVGFYSGNYVVEWPAGSDELYLAEGGGITGAGEPGVDGHWIKCVADEPETDGSEPEATPAKDSESSGLPSIGAFATVVGILAASAFVRREDDR